MKQIQVTEPFLFDLRMLASSADNLYKQLRQLRTVVRTADERWTIDLQEHILRWKASPANY